MAQREDCVCVWGGGGWEGEAVEDTAGHMILDFGGWGRQDASAQTVQDKGDISGILPGHIDCVQGVMLHMVSA